MTDVANAMREGMRRLASGVSVLATTGVDAKHYAMTVTSVTSVSDAPASLLVCVNQQARLHQHLLLDREFAIHVLTQSQVAVSVACSSGDQAQTRFDTGQWSFDERVPMLKDAEASFVCRIRAIHAYGTHSIVVGDIESVSVRGEGVDPLIYHNGGYARLTDI